MVNNPGNNSLPPHFSSTCGRGLIRRRPIGHIVYTTHNARHYAFLSKQVYAQLINIFFFVVSEIECLFLKILIIICKYSDNNLMTMLIWWAHMTMWPINLSLNINAIESTTCTANLNYKYKNINVYVISPITNALKTHISSDN